MWSLFPALLTKSCYRSSLTHILFPFAAVRFASGNQLLHVPITSFRAQAQAPVWAERRLKKRFMHQR
jgi:hypothetical protein